MKSILKICLGVFLVAGLTGCYSTETPKKVVASVAESLKKDDYKSYRSFLTARALKQIGSEKQFAKLQAFMKSNKGKASLQSKMMSEKGDLETGLYTQHNVTVLLDSRAVAQAGVICKSKREIREFANCYDTGSGAGGATICYWEEREVIDTNCKVDSIRY